MSKEETKCHQSTNRRCSGIASTGAGPPGIIATGAPPSSLRLRRVGGSDARRARLAGDRLVLAAADVVPLVLERVAGLAVDIELVALRDDAGEVDGGTEAR